MAILDATVHQAILDPIVIREIVALLIHVLIQENASIQEVNVFVNVLVVIVNDFSKEILTIHLLNLLIKRF
jgi:hypothetical protein